MGEGVETPFPAEVVLVGFADVEVEVATGGFPKFLSTQ